MREARGRIRRRLVASIAAILSLALIGCASGPLTKREKGAATGAAIGAGTGAIIGSTRGDAAEGAVIGGALGGLAGGLLGDQVEAQDQRQRDLDRRLGQQEAQMAENRRLIAELRERNLDARSTDRGVVVTLPDVLFEFGSSELTREARGRIRDIADVLVNQARGRRITVEGHTDSIGAVSYNQSLSERRAARVAMALASEGVPEGLMQTKGYGKAYPVAPNTNPDGSDNPTGRARNRRVEVVILN